MSRSAAPSAIIKTNHSVAGINFGSPEALVTRTLKATPFDRLERRVNANGEVELLHQGAIFRLQQNYFVEATFPDHSSGEGESKHPDTPRAYVAKIDGITVLRVFDWLAEQSGTVDIARFRVCERLGIAYDYRNPKTGSYTVFAPGHWAGLIG